MTGLLATQFRSGTSAFLDRAAIPAGTPLGNSSRQTAPILSPIGVELLSWAGAFWAGVLLAAAIWKVAS